MNDFQPVSADFIKQIGIFTRSMSIGLHYSLTGCPISSGHLMGLVLLSIVAVAHGIHAHTRWAAHKCSKTGFMNSVGPVGAGYPGQKLAVESINRLQVTANERLDCGSSNALLFWQLLDMFQRSLHEFNVPLR